MAPPGGPLATPTQATFSRLRSDSKDGLEKSPARDVLVPPVPTMPAPGARSMTNTSIFGPRSVAATPGAPGSFSSNLKTTNGARSLNPGGLRIDFGAGGSYVNRDQEVMGGNAMSSEHEASERRQAEFRDALNKEIKIKTGSENLLEALMNKSNPKQTKDQRMKVESELSSSNRKIAELRGRLADEIERSKISASIGARPVTPNVQPRPSFMSNREVLTADGGRESLDDPDVQDEFEAEEEEEEEESPSFVLGEILQTLERDGMPPEYYVSRANVLVELLQRHPTLKYDLAWSIFGLRIQTMLLSESRDVVAAGYRLTRHAVGDRRSLQTIRDLQTDALVVLSLAKDDKARIEREQALKFVRAFVDVKGGVGELSVGVIRAVISVAEHYEDRLRNMALLTLAEVLVRDPHLLVSAGGVLPLAEALKDGMYPGGESLVTSFMHLSDTPQLRELLFIGQEVEGPFGLFSDSLNAGGSEDRLRAGLQSIAALLNSWPGLFTLSRTGFSSVSALFLSLQHPSPTAHDLILDLLFGLLHIKPPSWTSSFLAGRRLTTYGRVRAIPHPSPEIQEQPLDDAVERLSLLDHWTTLLLSIFVQCGLVQNLTTLVEESEEQSITRKATILLAEIQKLADHTLPPSQSHPLQSLHSIMRLSMNSSVPDDESNNLQNMVYQLDSVSKTMTRTNPAGRPRNNSSGPQPTPVVPPAIKSETKYPIDMNEVAFREALVNSDVLNHVGVRKWNWNIIQNIIEGPLMNRKLFYITVNDTKWLKRLFNCYRPFKYRFCELQNSKAHQRIVRTGALLVKTLLTLPEGVQYMLENKLFRQLAECLAQLDPASSGITADQPMFSRERVRDTLTGGYFQLLGALSTEQQGLAIISRWRMLNMFYHVVDLHDRDDLITLLLGSMSYSLDSHLRVILSKALTSGEKPIRIFATRILRKYATQTEQRTDGTSSTSSVAYWALRLLITQLYDPSVEVSEVAVQILQEACDRSEYLEFVVRCRPALDHLGEIGAPLLLRFLSSSNGYKYLSGLDYITQEMDDWFLGRNEKYVAVVEASLSRALAYDGHPGGAKNRARSTSIGAMDEEAGLITTTQAASLVPEDRLGDVPPHFYRELVRTPDGCRLLEESGHFEAFSRHIRNATDAAENAAKGEGRRNTIASLGSVGSGSRNSIAEQPSAAQAAAATDPEMLLRVKSCLWAVGNVGSMELGAPFLESSGVVERIVRLAAVSPVATLRGTAFFVLGLISRSWHGMEILAEHGWDAATDQLGRSLGYVLPPRLDALFNLGDYGGTAAERRRKMAAVVTQQGETAAAAAAAVASPWSGAPTPGATPGKTPTPSSYLARQQQQRAAAAAASGTDEWETKVYAAVVESGNTVLQRRALGELAAIKTRRADLFRSPAIFRRVLALFEGHSIKLPVRQRVFDMFDRQVLRRIVLEDSDSGSGSDIDADVSDAPDVPDRPRQDDRADDAGRDAGPTAFPAVPVHDAGGHARKRSQTEKVAGTAVKKLAELDVGLAEEEKRRPRFHSS